MITFSEKESNVLGVRVARGVLNHNWQPTDLLADTLQGGYDFLRLKIPSTDEQVFEKLDKLGMHYSLHSILVRNSVAINQGHAALYRPLRVTFELYNGSNETELKQLVKDSWGNRTAVNYHNAHFRHWVSYEQEMEGSAAYATEFNYRIDSNMPNWIISLQGKPIGFVLGKVSEEGFEGVMYSIIPAFRGHNYAEDIMLFLKKWCFEQGIPCFYNDVVFQNMASLKSIVTESIVPVETYLNVTVSAMLNVHHGALIEVDANAMEGLSGLPLWIEANKHQWEQPGDILGGMRTSFGSNATQLIDFVRVSVPIRNGKAKIVLLRLMHQSKPLALVYLTYLE